MFVIAGAHFIQRGFKNRLFTSLLVMTGVGSVGAGVVAENISLPVHSVFALVAFVFGAASAIMSYKFEKSPLSYVSVILSAVTLLAIVLFILGEGSSGFCLGLGLTGMERFTIYPLLLWMLGFGAYLLEIPTRPPQQAKHRIGHKLHSARARLNELRISEQPCARQRTTNPKSNPEQCVFF
jgi:hypothetical membrane protein